MSQLTASVAVGETDIRDIGKRARHITVTGSNIAPPALASVGALDSVNLTIPGAGGQLRLLAARRLGVAASITAFPGAPVAIALQYANGQLSTQAEVNVDVHAIIPPLAGNVSVGYRAASRIR